MFQLLLKKAGKNRNSSQNYQNKLKTIKTNIQTTERIFSESNFCKFIFLFANLKIKKMKGAFVFSFNRESNVFVLFVHIQLINGVTYSF